MAACDDRCAEGHFVVLNLHEVVLDAEIMDNLLQLDQLQPVINCASVRVGAADGDSDNDGDKVSGKTCQTAMRPGPAKGHRGQTPLHVAHPEVVEAVASFAELHGFLAQERRRDDIAHSNDVPLCKIQHHLRTKFLDLSISKDTIHWLMVAPNKRHTSSRLYKGLVNVRIPPKSNSTAKTSNPDLHFTMAEVAYANELFELFSDECIQLLVDDKNKINVGALAVLRYFQINRFFPVNDKPDYNDHDFPHPDCKIVPSGYLITDTKFRGRCHRRSSSLPLSQCADVSISRCSRSLSPPRYDLHGCATLNTD